MGIKSSDAATFPLCPPCHTAHDQGKDLTKEERRAATAEYIAHTHIRLLEAGLLQVK